MTPEIITLLKIAGIVLAVALLLSPRLLLTLLSMLIRTFMIRLRVFGQENVPCSGPTLLVSNHVSLLDLILLQSICPRRIRFMVRAELFNFLPARFIFRYLGVIIVPNGRRPKAMQRFFAKVGKRLRRGEVLCFFPEGAISGSGNLMRFRSGVEPLLPVGVPVTVLPVRVGMVHGRLTQIYKNRLRIRWSLRWPVDFSIIVGEPVDPHCSAFQLRQKISELGAIVEQKSQPGELPIHTAYILRAKRHFFRATFCDAVTGQRVRNFSMLVRIILISQKIRQLDHGLAGYTGVLLPNTPLTAGVLLSVLCADRTPAMINFSAGEDVALESARRVGIKGIITSRRFLEKLKWTESPEMVCLEDFAPTITTGMKVKAILRAIFTPRLMLVRQLAPLSCYNVHNQAVLLFSSGSTGRPKAVMLTHRNINCDIWSFYRVIAWSRRDRIAGNLPLFHAYGFTVEFAFPAQVGSPVAYVTNPLDATAVVKSIEQFGLTILTGTPTFMQRYLSKATGEQLKSLRLVVTGAEKLRAELADRFREMTGRDIIEGYGCTELAPIVTVNLNNSIFTLGTRADHPGSIGCPLPGIHVRIVDPETGVELGPGASGRMQVKAGTVMKGYAGDPDLTARVVQNGYYDTGDIAKMDDDGYIYITGRASRFSKIGGEMVPHEGLEDAISKIRGKDVREVAVTGRPDARKGERLVVFYAPEDFDVAVVIQKLRETGIPNLWIPKAEDFVKVPELPILGSGKLDLRRLKEMAEALA